MYVLALVRHGVPVSAADRRIRRFVLHLDEYDRDINGETAA
jgi:hypothetical protein